MIRRLVEFFLGPLGMQALAFYNEHSLAINGGVVLYGAVLTLAHLNLRRIEAAAIRTLRTDTSGPEAAHPAEIPWEETIAQASFFPWVAHGTSLIPRRTRADTLRRLCPEGELLKKAGGLAGRQSRD
jgi:hypothetical protein